MKVFVLYEEVDNKFGSVVEVKEAFLREVPKEKENELFVCFDIDFDDKPIEAHLVIAKSKTSRPWGKQNGEEIISAYETEKQAKINAKKIVSGNTDFMDEDKKILSVRLDKVLLKE